MSRLKSIIGSIWYGYYMARAVASIALRTRSLTCVRLQMLPLSRGGRFRFDFGTFEYYNPGITLSQYREIFIEKVYDISLQSQAPVIYDCGSNIGLSVARFKVLFPSSTITAFEADPAIADVLRRNLGALGGNGIRLIQTALSDKDGVSRFSQNAPDSRRIVDDGEIVVRCERLSRYIDGPVDLLKLDIEGSEFAVLHDLTESKKIRLVRNLICEIHLHEATAGKLLGLLRSLLAEGFRIGLSDAGAAPWLPGPTDPTPFIHFATGKSLCLLYAWRP